MAFSKLQAILVATGAVAVGSTAIVLGVNHLSKENKQATSAITAPIKVCATSTSNPSSATTISQKVRNPKDTVLKFWCGVYSSGIWEENENKCCVVAPTT